MWTVFVYLPDETSPTFFQPQHGRRISCPVLQCSLHLRYLIRDPREWIGYFTEGMDFTAFCLGLLLSSPCLWVAATLLLLCKLGKNDNMVANTKVEQ